MRYFLLLLAFVIGCTSPIPEQTDPRQPALPSVVDTPEVENAPIDDFGRLFVDPSAPARGLGIRARPYSSLQATIDYAMSLNVEAVERQIYVCGGTYESIEIPAPTGSRKAGLYITGGWACGERGWAKDGSTPTVFTHDTLGRSALIIHGAPWDVYLHDVSLWGASTSSADDFGIQRYLLSSGTWQKQVDHERSPGSALSRWRSGLIPLGSRMPTRWPKGCPAPG